MSVRLYVCWHIASVRDHLPLKQGFILRVVAQTMALGAFLCGLTSQWLVFHNRAQAKKRLQHYWTFGIFYDIIQSNLRILRLISGFAVIFIIVSRTFSVFFDCFPIFFFLLFLHPQQANGTARAVPFVFVASLPNGNPLRWAFRLNTRAPSPFGWSARGLA